MSILESEHESRLFKQLEHYNLEFLIPLHLNSDDDDAEGYCHTYSEMGDYYDPSQDEYYDAMFGSSDSDDDCIEEDQTNVKNLDDLLRIFNADYMDYDELLSMNIWDLFGISKKQFDLIDFSLLPNDEFCYFYNTFLNESRPISIEKRILYSMGDTLTDYRSNCLNLTRFDSSFEDRISYCERILDTHSIKDSIELLRMLRDYWRFYNDAVIMDRRRRDQGEHVFNYCELPKPSHLRDLHNKAFRDHMTLETERKAEDLESLNLQIKEVSDSEDYRRLLYRDADYAVMPVNNQVDLDIEGEYLNHCVASYGSYMARAASYIYFVRKQKELETPYFTAEIIPPEKSGGRFKLTQLYTFNDKTDKPDSLRKFIYEWAKSKGFAIRCAV